jgi:hypothetical protein
MTVVEVIKWVVESVQVPALLVVACVWYSLDRRIRALEANGAAVIAKLDLILVAWERRDNAPRITTDV